MKNAHRFIGIAVIAAIVFSFAACSGGDDGTGTGGDGAKTVPVTGVTLDKSTLSLTVGGSETLTPTVAPDNATNKAVTWSSSNAAAATVANGVVTAVAAGKATITVKTADGNKTATCTVTVIFVDPSKTPITTAEIDVTAPVYGGVPATAISGEAEHFTAGTVTWSPADNPFKPGTEYTATITLTAKDGYTFNASTAATVNGQTATISNITGGTITLSYKFPATSTKKVSDIAIKTQPTNLTYTHGDKLNLTGLSVTLTYDDTTTEDVAAANFSAKGITASPSAGDNLARSTHNGEPVTITYGSLTKTTGNLTVNAKSVSAFTIDAIAAQTYTGSEIKPIVTVKDGAETLTLTTDYTVSYSDNTVAGTATVTITGTGNYTGTKTANFTINKANPSVSAWPTAEAITYGAALSASALSGGDTHGTFAWTASATIPTVSNSGYSVTFTPTDTVNYNSATNTVSITVNKANPTVTAWPTAAIITYGAALSASALSGGDTHGTFAWTVPTTIPTVNNSGYSVTFTPTDTANYNTATNTVSITVNKANPTVTGWPTAEAITYGAALSASALSGGDTHGTFAWTVPTTIPTVNNSGYSVTFTPTDTANYNTATNTVNITVRLVEMVTITGGTFTMGSPTSESGRNTDETQHSVTLTGFSIGKYQITQEQYQEVMGSNPSNFKTAVSGENGTPGKLPVEKVSWYDALVFCNKLSIAEGLSPVYSISGKTNPSEWGAVPTSSDATWNAAVMVNGANGYRLPTEAQWEYACRAGTTTAYHTGATISDNTGWYSSNSGSKTHQVGLKTANAWGLYDMHGNVFEWCWDWYDANYLSSSTSNDPTGAVSGAGRVDRGGSWNDSAEYVRSAFRRYAYPADRSENLGFRLVRQGQ